jgi:thiamine biosynthesis protein ThiS
MMTITVNGQKKEIETGIHLGQLLDNMQLNPDCVAVECNLIVIEREAFVTTQMNDGDTLEIVSFVGGG